jgi:hypothetical protein
MTPEPRSPAAFRLGRMEGSQSPLPISLDRGDIPTGTRRPGRLPMSEAVAP